MAKNKIAIETGPFSSNIYFDDSLERMAYGFRAEVKVEFRMARAIGTCKLGRK